MALAEQLRTGGTATGATGAVGAGALGSGAVGSGAGAAETAEVPAVAEVTGAVEVLSAFVAGFEPARFSGSDAETLVGLFTRASRLCEAGKALSAKRATDANRHQASGFKTPSQWLASVTGDSVGDAADTLELASTMERHPGVEHSYRKGKLSKARAKAVGEAVRANPDSEGELLGAAEGSVSPLFRAASKTARSSAWRADRRRAPASGVSRASSRKAPSVESTQVRRARDRWRAR